MDSKRIEYREKNKSWMGYMNNNRWRLSLWGIFCDWAGEMEEDAKQIYSLGK